ncbi:rod shape-determining protein MreC [Mangrovibacillus cuniculi]|uniref:Cell shape-determining protein MreC n=1 Tax=Mangrovibacillus cuniculi TaxID=2593652 RepID=A0A7S8CBQ7_9BACI|nr:rod shape-determining protein MreC [Mangrovibacillus cuniculi]QPC47049.1 rod shape-determining protein MreC [Mangrovibacillus cuniculi]
MPSFFLNKRLLMLLIGIIILVALLGFSLRDRENTTVPEQFLKDIVGFGQSIFSRPANGVAGFFEDVQDLRNTYEENGRLKAQLEELAQLKADVYDLKQDNDKLREMLDIQDNLRDYTHIQATVIARNPARLQDLVVINKGQVHGVETDMAVRSSKGLIGKVVSTSQLTSTVELVSTRNPENRISALIQSEDRIFGLIEGYDDKSDRLLLKRIPYDVEVKEGELVETSGLGGIFPAGLPIGEVEKVEADPLGLTQTAYIIPAADLYDLEHVMVVERSMVSPDIPEATPEEVEQ